jgi:bile acid-coenzyme A ligase
VQTVHRDETSMSDPANSALEISLGARLSQLAALSGADLALSCGDERRSWAELDRRTNRLARALAARGVGHGDFVTIALPNCVGFL